MAYNVNTATVAEATAKINAVKNAKAVSPTPTGSTLVDPSGKRTSITNDQASSYSQGKNSLAQGYRVETPSSIPNAVANSGVTTEDVKNKRNQMESEATASQQFQSYLTSQGTSQTDAAQIAGFMFPEQSPEMNKAYESSRSWMDKAGDYLTSLTKGKSSEDKYQDRLDAGGYGDAQTALQESNVRLANLRGEQLKLRPQIEGEAGQTRIGAEARLSPIERQLTAEIGAEALIQAALSGNVQMIEQNATKLMEFEFADQDRELKMFEQRIKLEEARIESLTGQNKEQAAARLATAELMLQDRQDKLDTAKDEKKQLIDFAKTYLEKTGDGAGAAAILKGNLQDAVTKYGSSLKAGGENPTTITLTPEQRRLLVDANFTEQEALAIESDIRTYGIEQVIAQSGANGATEGQKNAIRQAFGGGQTTPQTITKEALRGILGSAASAKAKDAGFYTPANDNGFWGRATDEVIDTEGYLNSIMSRVALMRSQNMNDTQIIKELFK